MSESTGGEQGSLDLGTSKSADTPSEPVTSARAEASAEVKPLNVSVSTAPPNALSTCNFCLAKAEAIRSFEMSLPRWWS